MFLTSDPSTPISCHVGHIGYSVALFPFIIHPEFAGSEFFASGSEGMSVIPIIYILNQTNHIPC